MLRLASLSVAVCVCVGLVACSKSDPAPTSTAPPRERAGGAVKGGAAEGGGLAQPTRAVAPESTGPDSSFQLTQQQPAPTAAGGETVARLVVHPGEGYKMNKDFPTKLTLEPPAGVNLSKTVLEPADAEQFTEKELAFAVKMTAPTAGEYTIPGTIKFAVCTDTTCDPKKQKVALTLKAN